MFVITGLPLSIQTVSTFQGISAIFEFIISLRFEILISQFSFIWKMDTSSVHQNLFF